MKTIKKLGLIIAIILMILAIANVVNATDATVEEKISETGFKYTLEVYPSGSYTLTLTGTTNTSAKVLEIPNEIDGYEVTVIGENAFKGMTSLEKVVFADNIESVKDYAFSGCTNLKEVELNAEATLYTKVFEDTAIETLVFPADKTATSCSFEGATLDGMNHLKSIYIYAKDKCWIFDHGVSEDEVMSEETLEYLRNNVTIYGYSSTYEIDDNINSVPYSPKGFAQARGIKFVDLATLEENTIADAETEITLYGNVGKTAKLSVRKMVEGTEEYKDVTSGLEGYDIALAYDISVVDGDYEGKLKVTLPVESKYNGRTALVLHKKADGTVERFSPVVENGFVTVEVTELSPFVVAFEEDTTIPNDDKTTSDEEEENIKDVPKEDKGELDESPKTGENNIGIILASVLSIITYGAIIVIKSRK